MYSHTLTHLSYRPLCFIMFVSGICLGSLLGFLFIFTDPTLIGILAGAFIAFITGLFSVFLTFIYTLLFNLLAPVFGGIHLEILPLPSTAQKDSLTESPHSTVS